MRHAHTTALSLAAAAALTTPSAHAATYQVGPARPHTTLQQLVSSVALTAGDIVEVDGGHTYPGGVVLTAQGDENAPIVIRGVPGGGPPPRIAGGTNSVEFRGARDVVLDGFDISGGSSRCVFNAGHRITVRNATIHDCPGHGILGADQESGSFTLEHSELRTSGAGLLRHTLYMQTDEIAHPGAVVRIRYNYIHSANGGNLLKSRAERTEVHCNWFQGATYHEVELIGPDQFTQQDGWTEALVREDHELTGNVIVHTSTVHGSLVRLGGDGTGQSHGRYRVAYNTFIAQTGTTALRLFDGIQSLEAHNNVFHRPGAGTLNIVSNSDVQWVDGERIFGANNWIETGTGGVPAGLQATLSGTTPGFLDEAGLELIPAPASALVDHAAIAPGPVPGYAFPQPGALPPACSPIAARDPQPFARIANGAPDIGAYEALNAGYVFRDGFE